MITGAFALSDPNVVNGAYLVAIILFVVGLKQLGHPRTARRGNGIAAVGMAIAVAATLVSAEVVDLADTTDWILIAVGILVGSIIGILSARAVKMTAMPQMVALFNGVGGGAVALIAWAEFRAFDGVYPELAIAIPSLFAAIVGSVSFWGSNVAFGKLQEILPGRPIKLPGQQVINALLLLIAIACAIAIGSGETNEWVFVAMLVVAAILGNMVVLPIGGADMPVVISLLNAFTGLSAAAAGIALNNIALIVAGILVGASGSILTKLMADAMNRSIWNVVAGGFGGGASGGQLAGIPEGATVKSTTAQDAALQLAYAQQVVVVPGYGMAVAQAQHAVRELQDELEKRGVTVLYAIHPVAGRMPGHMNVLLAEADVPYDLLKEMDEVNPEFPRTDVSLVIGANDVTNPAARDNAQSPIYGMPILEVDKSESVIVLKRSMNPGFAGIENELYYSPSTALLFGDAKESVANIAAELNDI